MTMGLESPQLSLNSADEALLEILGMDMMELNIDAEDTADPPQGQGLAYELLKPPLSCHRQETSHSPLLLRTHPVLTQKQCEYIISQGNRASNDGGKTYGPAYVTSAQHGDAVVELKDPNHHKVCVFQDDIISCWLGKLFGEGDIFEAIVNWGQENQIWKCDDFRINPRLRLLRYDAADDDDFLPHYDATTTIGNKLDPAAIAWESKLTVLLYLNTEGLHFRGGRTLYLNATDASKHDELSIKPQQGQFVLFNHELYHASEPLKYDDAIKTESAGGFIIGGSKFVLRSDVMFRYQSNAVPVYRFSNCPPLEKTPNVRDVVSNLGEGADPIKIALQKLDIYDLTVSTFLVPGRFTLTKLIADMGIDEADVSRFVTACEATLSG